MTLQIIVKNSSVLGKEPTSDQLAYGELALNYHADGPFLTCRDHNDVVRRIAGMWIGSSAPTTPTAGEFWLDTNNQPGELKLYKDAIDGWISSANASVISFLELADIDVGDRVDGSILIYDEAHGVFKADSLNTKLTITDGGNF